MDVSDLALLRGPRAVRQELPIDPPVFTQVSLGHRHRPERRRLGVHQVDVPKQGRPGLVLFRDVHDLDVVALMAQDIQPAGQSSRVVEIADQDDQPSTSTTLKEDPRRPLDVRVGRHGLEGFEVFQKRQDLALAARHRELAQQGVGEGMHRHAVQVAHRDVRQRGRHMKDVMPLPLRRAHRLRGVKEQVDVEVLLLLEQLEQQIVHPRVDVPVQVAVVVARRVLAVVGELDARAEGGASSLRLDPPAKHAPRHQRQILQLLEEIPFEYGHRLTRKRRGCGSFHVRRAPLARLGLPRREEPRPV